MIQYKKLMMTLALLLTAVTGAWAEETPLVTIQASENSTFTSGSKTFNEIATVTITGNGYIDDSGWESCMLTVTPADGVTITSVKFYGTSYGDVVEDTSSPFEAEIKYDSNVSREVTKVNGTKAFDYGVKKIEVFGTAGPPLAVEWNASTKTGTFAMPGSDVVLTPIYAKAAAFATTGTETEVKTLLPEAAEGVIAGTDAPLIAEGTGIVATTMIGETPTAQGTVMYYVGTSAPTIGSDDWTEDVPTAKNNLITDNGAEVKVWYYIQGADAPDGETPTADNTFNNSDVCTTPLTVTVLSNKFDLTLKAANANTIDATQSSKGTVSVKVGDADAKDKTSAITNGKLEAVKMGSEVKLNTKAGYKFRKVEVKKKAEKTITIGEQNYTVLDGETWIQFIIRNKLSDWSVERYTNTTWRVRMDEGSAIFTLRVSTDGTNWTLLELTSDDAPIDTDKQYKWVPANE